MVYPIKNNIKIPNIIQPIIGSKIQNNTQKINISAINGQNIKQEKKKKKIIVNIYTTISNKLFRNFLIFYKIF